VWNFGGRINPEGQGYGSDYTLKKAEILNPLDIQKIGFSLSTNDAIASKIRESRYALWMINADGEIQESWNIPKNWDILLLSPETAIQDWSLF
jgi:hypothetical protein